MNKLIKRVALDSLGIFLILIAVPIGWLPGPGGIPLVLIGLGLLAKNNKWAQDLLSDFETKFKYYSNKLLHGSRRLQLGLDIIGLSILVVGFYPMLTRTGISRVIGSAFITSSLILLLINRNRGIRLYNKINRKKP